MKTHPAADLFPMMSDEDLQKLADDIRQNGQREPIVIHEDQILDGRNRYRALQLIGISPVYTLWDRQGTPEAFVVSMNLHRRHLCESQRAMIAARIANIDRGQVSGGKPRSGAEISVSQAAALMNVHHTTVSSARKVLREGTPEEIAAIDRGEAAASTAARGLRRGLSAEERKAKREKPQTAWDNPERIAKKEMEADVWARLSDALIALTSLPLPADVVSIVRKNPKRALVVDDRLARAFNWLEEFHVHWSKPRE